MAGPISRLSLNLKLPLLIGALLATVMGVFAVLAYRVASRTALDAASARLEMVTGQYASLLGDEVDGALRLLRASSTDSTLVALASGDSTAAPAARAFLLRLARDSNPGTAAELRHASGRLRLSAHPESALDGALAAAAPARPDSAAVGELYVHDGAIYYEFGTPIRASNEDPLHLVIRRRLGGPEGSMQELVRIIGTDAHLLLGNRAGPVWGDLGSELGGVVPGVARGGEYRRAGRERLGSRVELDRTPWALAAEFSRDGVVAGARSMARDVGLIALGILGIGIGLGWLLSRRLTAPLTRLTAQAEAVAGDGRTPLAPAGGHDEIGRLSDAFHTMVGRVEDGHQRLRTSEAQYRLLFDQNPNPMWVFDRATLEFLAVNEAAVRKYGYSREEFLGRTLLDIRPPEDAPALIDAVKGGPYPDNGRTVWRHLTRDGKSLDVEVTGRSIAFAGRDAELVLALDVTERRALEAQLRQAQKMEAVGRLAGGVAHDFNNILTVIQTAAEFLLADLEAGDARRGDAVEIQAAAQRATELTRQLLAFSRQQLFELRVLNLNEVIAPLEPMLRRLVEENIRVVTHLAPGLGSIEADTTQIQQVILNLVVNARDAIPGAGTILIETANIVLDDTYPRSLLVAPPGPYVVLTVTDNGTGMDAATQAHIFEPFFTTKEVGHGTGLGLATVYGIVKQLGGQIWVYSELGQGTTFKLYFRRHEAAGVRAPVEPPAERRQHRRAGARLLLVEDDVPVRTAVRRVLERHGYEVIEAESGAEVVARLGKPGHGVDLIVSDMVMPGMTGIELRRKVQELDPAVPLLLMSGYSQEALTRLANREVLGPLIEKPFTMDGLLQKVEAALEAAPSAAARRPAPRSP